MDNNTSSYIETMKKVATIFNKNNIRYALAGGVVAELRSGIVKAHKDVDFAIFGDDMQVIEEILKSNGIYCRSQLVQLNENDNWVDTTGHNKTGKDINTGIDIGFFLFSNQEDEFGEDGELISETGFIRKTEVQYRGKKITLRERMNSELEGYLFNPDRVEELDGVSIKVQPLAYIMMLKARNLRGKDRQDLVNTTQLLTDEEIDEYNRFKNSILSIFCTAQMGASAKEGKCEEVKRVVDILEDKVH